MLVRHGTHSSKSPLPQAGIQFPPQVHTMSQIQLLAETANYKEFYFLSYLLT